MSFAQTDTLNQTDDAGQKHGYWIKKIDRGTKQYEGRFNHGVPVGEFTYYDYKEKESAHVVFREDGTGDATIFYTNRKVMAKGPYLNKLKSGMWFFYDGNGNLSAKEEYAAGKRHGVSVTFYDNGQVSRSTEFVEGLETGERLEFWPDGTKKFEGSYIDGNPDGNVVYYSVTGKVEMEGSYRNAVKDGVWKFYNEKGFEKLVRKYDLGRVEKEVMLDN